MCNGINEKKEEKTKKRLSLLCLLLAVITVFAFSLTACNNEVGTLETLKNEYGIVVEGGSFEEGSALVSNEIAATTEEAVEVLAAIAEQNYNKDGTITFETDHFSQYAVIGITEDAGLGTGAIVGIVIGSALVAGVGGFALLWFVIKKKSFADLIAVFKRK